MLDVEFRDDIAVVRMAHGKANALDIEFCRALVTQVNELSSTARGLVLTGSGTIFSAGVDLLRVLDEGGDYVRHFLGFPSRMVSRKPWSNGWKIRSRIESMLMILIPALMLMRSASESRIVRATNGSR